MEDYYDLDNILSEEEKIPVSFLYPAWQLGFLDPGSGEEDLKRGAKVEVSVWLGKELQKNKYISLETPKLYGPKMRGALNADSQIISLHSTPFFYHLGSLLAAM